MFERKIYLLKKSYYVLFDYLHHQYILHKKFYQLVFYLLACVGVLSLLTPNFFVFATNRIIYLSDFGELAYNVYTITSIITAILFYELSKLVVITAYAKLQKKVSEL